MARERIRAIKQSSGQALIVMTLAMPLLLSMSALVLDGTNVMVNKRQMQNAADAAALAAAQELGSPLSVLATCATGNTACRVAVQLNSTYTGSVAAVASDYVAKNWDEDAPPLTRCASAASTNCWSWPYEEGKYGVHADYDDDAYERVLVRLNRPVGGFVASVTGALGVVDVGARAVAATVQHPVLGIEAGDDEPLGYQSAAALTLPTLPGTTTLPLPPPPVTVTVGYTHEYAIDE